MRHIRMLGLCLAAVMVVVAFAASSAFAKGPEWGQCYAKAGGKYANAGCTTKAKKGKGEYEWRKGAEITHRKFTGEGGTGILNADLEACVRGNEDASCTPEQIEKEEAEYLSIYVECTHEHAIGEAKGKDEVTNVQVVFTGCKALGSLPCSNSSNAEEVKVNLLKGELGYINKSNKEVGVDLTPVVSKGSFAQFNCGTDLTTTVGVETSKKEKPVYPGKKGGGDGIISPVTPIDQMSDAFTQTYTTTEADENIPNKFEGKPLQVLEAQVYNTEQPEYIVAWSKAGESITNVNTPEEEVEIKA